MFCFPWGRSWVFINLIPSDPTKCNHLEKWISSSLRDWNKKWSLIRFLENFAHRNFASTQKNFFLAKDLKKHKAHIGIWIRNKGNGVKKGEDIESSLIFVRRGKEVKLFFNIQWISVVNYLHYKDNTTILLIRRSLILDYPFLLQFNHVIPIKMIKPLRRQEWQQMKELEKIIIKESGQNQTGFRKWQLKLHFFAT